MNSNQTSNKAQLIEPKTLIYKLKTFLINNKLPLLTVIIIGLITHFYLYTHNVISTDALQAGNYYIAGTWELSLGRWGIAFLNILKGGIVNEFLNILICLILLALSSTVAVKILNIKSKAIIFLISALIATAPQFAESFMYIYCADTYCLAMLTSLLSVYFMRKENKRVYNITSTVMIIITCSIYQTYIGITVGLTIFLSIFDVFEQKENKEVLKNGLRYIIIEILGILLYYAITVVILKITGVSFASYSGADNIGILNTIKNLHLSIFGTYKTFIKYFFTDKILYNSYWKRNIINLIIFIVTAISGVLVVVKNKIYKDKTKIILLIILLILIPVGTNIICLMAPERGINLIMATSLLLVYFAILKIYELLKQSNLEIILKYFILGTVSVLCITYIFSNNVSYMCREETYQNYYVTQLRILTKVQNLEEYSPDMKIMFSDTIRFDASLKQYANGFKSNDYETWDNFQGILTNKHFYKRYFGIDINLCTQEEYENIINSDEFKEMEIFPKENSVKIIDNIIVVKLSDNNILE